jgi:hypothetical protein
MLCSRGATSKNFRSGTHQSGTHQPCIAFIAAFSKFTLFQNQSVVAVASWVATIPVSMGLSAFIYWIIAKILLG